MRPELNWLFGRQRLGVNPGLGRTRALLASVDDPQEAFECILVAGTNGKGSTATTLAECLRASGRRTALYTSPHLSRLGERFVVDGRETELDAVAEAVGEIREASERVGASFFETITAAACLLFRREGVEVAVMEVGLGGRFDATNALEPRISVVTGISLDHTDLLGSTEEAIAGEKAGVFRGGRLALTAAVGDALATLRTQAASLGTPLWVVGEEIRVEGEDLGWQGLDLTVRCPAGTVHGRSALVGAHQEGNVALAVAAALALGVTPRATARGMTAARWPGRLERVRAGDRWVVFDGAHNAEAALALSRALAHLERDPCTLVVGMSEDKDLRAFAEALRPVAARVFATRARYSPRAKDAAVVAEAFGEVARAVDDPSAALEAALQASEPGGTVVVAGSLYLVGELRALVLNEPFDPYVRWQ